jgi:hypothetical protein
MELGLASAVIGITLMASVSAFVLTGPRLATATVLQVGWALVLLWTASLETILLRALLLPYRRHEACLKWQPTTRI